MPSVGILATWGCTSLTYSLNLLTHSLLLAFHVCRKTTNLVGVLSLINLGPVYTMNHEVILWKMAFVNGPSSWSDFKKISFESLGSLARCKPNVDQEESPCTKKWRCWFFFKYMPKKGSIEKNSSLTILLSSLGLHLSSLLVKYVEVVACKSSQNNFYKKKWAI